MKIRCMTTDDLTRAAAFTAAEGWSSETLTTFESFHANDPQGCFIAEEHGRCTGICVATGYRRSGFVGELIIAPGRRNRGNGRRLLQHAIDYLRGRGRYADGNTPPPAVVLMNNAMPRVDGLTALELIRQCEEHALLPVVVFTGTESERKETRSYDLGANAYIVKPLEYRDLVRVVRRIHDFWEIVEVPEMDP